MTPDEFWSTPHVPADPEPSPESKVKRDRWDRPLIIQPDGSERAYHRASSFGKQIENTHNLEKWGKRQVARGMAISPELAAAAPHLGEPGPQDKQLKKTWDAIADRAMDAAGSNVKSALGTAIHEATELVDRGESISHLSPLLQERAIAYWHFCQREGIIPTSVEVFGVDDVHRVAGTWDRTAWWRRRHIIADVKTSGSMDFAGIGFAVQLAEYAHMSAYDFETGARTPHERMDLTEGIIIHVDRELHGPVELFTVDLTVGWEYAVLVDQVKKAQKEGTYAIRPAQDLDEISGTIVAAQTEDELHQLWEADGARWRSRHKELASECVAALRAMAA